MTFLCLIVGIGVMLSSWKIETSEYEEKTKSLYQFPLKRQTKSLCIQSNNTLSTHQGRLKYSYDFLLPQGTEIYASRSGIVQETLSTVSGIGNFKGNFISILHPDSTLAIYGHLKKNGILVAIGDSIKAGQLIGYSGFTGRCVYPHLHFHVEKKGQTIPVTFSDLSNDTGIALFLHAY